MFIPVLAQSCAQIGLSSFSFTASVAVTAVAKEFFTHLFFFPFEHISAIMVMGAVVLAAGVGSAYLIRRLFNRYVPFEKIA